MAVIDAAEARTYHVGAVFGPGLFVHGGMNRGETQETLTDWNLFDFGYAIWIQAHCYEVQPEGNPIPFVLARKMHSLSPILEPNIQNGKELTRKMWACSISEMIG